jgi:hypothetical protein
MTNVTSQHDITSHINQMNYQYGGQFTNSNTNNICHSNVSHVDTKCQKAFLHSAIRSLGSSSKPQIVGLVEQSLSTSSPSSTPEQVSPVHNTTTQFFNNNFTRPITTSLGRKHSAPNIPMSVHAKFSTGNNTGRHTSPIATHNMTSPVNIPNNNFTLPSAAAATTSHSHSHHSSNGRTIHSLRKMKISRSPGALSNSPSYQSPLTSKLSAFLNPVSGHIVVEIDFEHRRIKIVW